MKVRWKTTAIRDVNAHVAYLSQFNVVAARELAVSLFAAGDSLNAFPNRGRKGRIEGTREMVALYPYIIVYETTADTVIILRIWHGSLLE